MLERNHESDHFVISPTLLYALLAAFGFGGSGLYGVFGPSLEANAIEACYDNSKIAISVAEQHGKELNKLRDLILDRTSDRYTSEAAIEERRRIEQSLDLIRRRLQIIEDQQDRDARNKKD